MERDVKRYCKACHGCQLVTRPDPPEQVRTTTLPSGPWRDLAVGLLGPLLSGESILVVVDYYSRYYEIDVLRSTVTSKIITCLEDIFSRRWLPETLTSDNGAEQKARYKAYADARRGAKYSNTNIGDDVLVKQEKQNKLTTTFSPVPYKVLDKKGNSQQIESSDGVQYSRNTSHVKNTSQKVPLLRKLSRRNPSVHRCKTVDLEKFPATLGTPIRLQLRRHVDQDHKGQGSPQLI